MFALMEEHAQDQLHEPGPSLGLAVQEPVVAHAPQAGGQDVLQHAPEEVGDGELAISGAFGAGIDVAKGHGARRWIMRDQIALAEDAAIDLMTEREASLFPVRKNKPRRGAMQ